jgi:FKBP-type peptidyl-prolyl cis-trans isomerase
MVCLALLVGVACGEEPEPNSAQPGAEDQDSDCDTSEQELESGLKFKELECGDGKEAKSGDILVVHYTGKLEDGTTFDSSVGGEPFPFQLGAGMVIQGWDLGFEGMKEGGKRELTIPPELGYGEAGAPPDIPPNSTLIFEVELVEVQEASSQ